MLLRLLSRLLGREPAPTTPGDPLFWKRLGHTDSRAEQIASCFPEYWEKRRPGYGKRYARYCLAQQLGDIPVHFKYPEFPGVISPRQSDATDPLAWVRARGHDVFTLAEAVQIAVIAARNERSRKLKPARKKWQEFYDRGHNPKRKSFHYDATRTPDTPAFWRQLGHNPPHARRLARCCPEYWQRRKKCSWKRAIALTRGTLKRLAARLKTPDHHFYDLAESTKYEIAKRDPAHWYLDGHDWDAAGRKAISEAILCSPERCRQMFQARDLFRQSGPQSELLFDGAVHVSGPLLGYQKEYERIQERRRKKMELKDRQVRRWPRWGPLELDRETAAKAHCCVVGNADGGTDIVLQALMQSVATHRWLVFDGRNDLLPSIVATRPDDEMHILNPLDARSCAWDLADDAGSARQTQEIVAALLPADSQHDTFLLESARAVLAAVIDTLNERAGGKWSLLHLVAAVEPPNLQSVLRSTPAAERVCTTHLVGPHAGLVASFLQSRLQPLKPIAAAWQHAKRKISIATWLQSSSTLVLVSSFRHQHLLAPLNRILFHLLASSLVEPNAFPPQGTWVFLSALCQIGRLEALSTLLSRGMAAGVTVALSVEDVELLQRHYGPEATGILGMCGNYAFLRIPNPATARWASQILGVAKVQVLYETEGSLSGTTSRSVTITPVERPLVPPTAFQDLPPPTEGRGPTGYFRNLGGRAYKGQIDLQRFIANQWLREPQSDTPAFVPRPDEQLQFPQDSAAVLAALGFSLDRRSRRPGTRTSVPATPNREPKRETSDQAGPDEYQFDPSHFPRLDTPSE